VCSSLIALVQEIYTKSFKPETRKERTIGTGNNKFQSIKNHIQDALPKSRQIEFFKQNVFNEKLNITKNSFTCHLGDLCRTQLLYISPINLSDGLYSRSEMFAHML